MKDLLLIGIIIILFILLIVQLNKFKNSCSSKFEPVEQGYLYISDSYGNVKVVRTNTDLEKI